VRFSPYIAAFAPRSSTSIRRADRLEKPFRPRAAASRLNPSTNTGTSSRRQTTTGAICP
jgi:hypothetical protein